MATKTKRKPIILIQEDWLLKLTKINGKFLPQPKIFRLKASYNKLNVDKNCQKNKLAFFKNYFSILFLYIRNLNFGRSFKVFYNLVILRFQRFLTLRFDKSKLCYKRNLQIIPNGFVNLLA